MTVKEIKAMNSEIKRLLRKIERLRSAAVNISPTLSSMPKGGTNEDKMSANIAEIADTEEKLRQLRETRNSYLDKLSVDNDIENCIWLHLARGYSWRKIANVTDGRPDTADSIRMRCKRYVW